MAGACHDMEVFTTSLKLHLHGVERVLMMGEIQQEVACHVAQLSGKAEQSREYCAAVLRPDGRLQMPGLVHIILCAQTQVRTGGASRD